MTLSIVLHSAALKGAVTGFVSAAAVDLHVLLSGQDWSVLKTFDWKKASYRWMVGIVTGALTGAGLGTML